MTKIYKKVLSFVLSLSVLALTIVGAFAVNFGTTSAAISESNISWSQYKDQLLQHYPLEMWSGTNFSVFDDIITNHLEDHDYFIALAVGRNQDGAYDFDYFACSIFRTNSTGNYKWANDSTGKLITISGTFNYFSEAKMFACNPSQTVVWSAVNANLNYFHTSRFNNTVSFTYGNQFANTAATRNQEGCFLFCNQDVYDNAGNLISAKNLTLGPQPTYTNVIIKTGDRYYFTISDQSLIRAGAAGDDSIRIDLGSSDPNFTDYYVCPCIDFTYLAIYAYPGITNISINGILGWDITDVVKFTTAEFISFSEFLIADDFGNNQVAIVRDNVPDPWSTYYDYLNQFMDALDVPSVPVPDQVPNYVSQQITTNYPGNVYVTTIGDISGFVQIDEFPSVSFDSVLVIDAKAFDVLSVQLAGVLTMQENVFAQSFLPELLQQVDLICVMQHSDFDYVVSDYANHPDNFLYFQPNQWQISGTPYAHGMWYIAKVIDSHGTGDPNKKPCYSFVTQRYLQKCNNWILSDGVDFLYKSLNALNDNQTNFFSGALNAIGAAVASIQLCNGKLSQLYDYFTLELNLADKFNSIIDKLDKIVDNTNIEGEENSFWIAPLYNFIKLFEPSESDYTSSISEIVSTLDELPDIPSVTPVAIPTSQIFLPGE